MSGIAIRVENLSKLHHICARSAPRATLRERVAGARAAPVSVGEPVTMVTEMLTWPVSPAYRAQAV